MKSTDRPAFLLVEQRRLESTLATIGVARAKLTPKVHTIVRPRRFKSKAIRQAAAVSRALDTLNDATDSNEMMEAAYRLGRASAVLEDTIKRMKGGRLTATNARANGDDLLARVEKICRDGTPKQKAFIALAGEARNPDSIRNAYYKLMRRSKLRNVNQ